MGRRRKQRRREPKRDDAPFGKCQTCDQPLGKPGGYADTDLCGPCCTGEALTFSEFGETW